MRKLNIIIVILFLVNSSNIHSQQVLSSGGNAPTPTTITQKNISFTIGEPLITTGEDDKIITQGFQQPNNKGRLYDAGVNAFSPNDDGNNDTWQFKKDSEDYEIEIFSRWGNIVWNNNENTEESEWNGIDKNGNKVPDGTYYYTVFFQGEILENGTGYIEVTR